MHLRCPFALILVNRRVITTSSVRICIMLGRCHVTVNCINTRAQALTLIRTLARTIARTGTSVFNNVKLVRATGLTTLADII